VQVAFDPPQLGRLGVDRVRARDRQLSDAQPEFGGPRGRQEEPGEAGIYWTTLSDRLVVLTFFGPDKALKKITPIWDGVRNSLKVEPPPPKGAPSPTPKPK